MSNFRKTKVRKITSVFLSLTTAIWLSATAMAFMPIVASAVTIEELQAQIALLQSQLLSLQGQTQTTTTGYTFASDLKVGSTGADVKNLQIVLNKDSDTKLADSGVGSPGNETEYFGPITKSAAIKFQEKYAADVLSPIGLSSGTGYVGSMTRSKLNALYGGGVSGGTTGETTTTTTTTTGETTTTTTGETTTTTAGLTVEAGIQPVGGLAPNNAARIPFTVLRFTATGGSDVTVNSVTVERTGQANDAAFSGVVLLDESGLQVGLEKTLNSVHQVTFNEAFTVKAGEPKILTIAGNRANTTSYAGQWAYFALAAVNTSATVNATLPITGTGHTINETLGIGSVTMARGPLDPSTDATKEIGTTGYTFSSVKVTAGSNEKVRLLSIRWNQSGSAAKDDLANVKTYVEGTAYDSVVSSDGKYYTSSFGADGLLIDKGFSKEISVKGDFAGGSARTVDFDLYKRTDLYLKGEDYKYGITPPNGSTTSGSDDGNFHQNTNPWYDAFQATVSAGTLNISKATSVAAQNIAINVADQPLGGFEIEAKGEQVTAANTTFRILISNAGGSATPAGTDLDNVALYDENGAVVAGPIDATGSGLTATAAFTDTITFSTGKHVYTLKGKLSSTGFENNDTVSASTTPSSDWSTVKGLSTGVTVTPTPSSAVTGNTMTVKAGALEVNVSAVPLAQTVIAGTSQYLFAAYILNAGNSGEDISLNALKVEYNAGSNATKLTTCQLYDGSSVLTTGSNIKNPSAAASSTTFTFDAPLIISKGTSKTISLKCDVAGNATAGNVYAWGIDATTAANSNISPVGKTSGQDITETVTDSAGQAMTIAASGSYTVINDSTQGYTVVSAGSTGVTLLKLKFSATNEDIDIQRVDFELGNLVATSSALDLANGRLTLYDSAAPTVAIATADFTTSRFATSTLIEAGNFRIPSGLSKTLLVKGDIAAITANGPITRSGELLQISYDGGANGTAGGNYGKGASSGVTIDGPAISDITATGVRIFKSYPSFAKVDLSANEKILQTGSQKILYKFKVTANGGDVYVNKFTFSVSSSTVSATTSTFGLYAYTDSGYSSADTSFSTDGLLNAGSCYNGLNAAQSAIAKYVNGTVYPLEIWMDSTSCNGATTTYKVPSGDSRWFVLTGTVTNVEVGTGVENINVDLEGDAAFMTNSFAGSLMGTASSTAITAVHGDTNNDFIWSPLSTSTSISISNLDFANGYGLTGLPTTNMAIEILTSTN